MMSRCCCRQSTRTLQQCHHRQQLKPVLSPLHTVKIRTLADYTVYYKSTGEFSPMLLSVVYSETQQRLSYNMIYLVDVVIYEHHVELKNLNTLKISVCCEKFGKGLYFYWIQLFCVYVSFNVTSHELGTVQENSTTSQIRLYTVRQKTCQNYFVISSRLLHKLTNFCKISYQLLPPTNDFT